MNETVINIHVSFEILYRFAAKEEKIMSYGKFINEGKGYVVNTPYTPTSWKNILFNDSYYMELSQTMQGNSYFLTNYNSTVNTKAYRHFYILLRDSGEVITPLNTPFKTSLDSFSCEYGLGFSEVKCEYKNVNVSARAFVPVEGEREIWTISITNNSDTEQEFSLFSAFPYENSGPMGGECRFMKNEEILYKYSFPYHVLYEDKKKVENNKAYHYIICDEKINSYDGSGQRFYGCDNVTELPKAVINGVCSNIDSEGEEFTGSIENRFSLLKGEVKTINIILGMTRNKEEMISTKVNFPDVQDEFNKVNDLWDKRCSSFTIETPEEELNYLVNYWLKKQVVFLTRLNRTSNYCPVRNQLQDALGYSMIEPYEALEYALKVLRRQHDNGYIKQWYMTDSSPEKPLCLINHSDAPIWLILCIVEIIEKCGDKEIYNRLETYMNSDNKESIMIHLKKAAYYMWEQIGEHGLCLMLDGDWTDPVNGAGRLGKGESTWNSMALLYCVKRLIKLCEGEKDRKLDEIAEKLDASINKYCWDGNWYVAGFDDNGKAFGSFKDKEGKIFLNAQSWAIISGAARGERLQKVRQSMDSLKTPFGYLLLSPAFSKWNDSWGRISVKQPGTTENGAVYCHGSMFKALGDIMAGDGDAAIQTLLDTLPINPKNPPENSLQLPLFIPNYYFGLMTENIGRSSCHYGTGTTAWFLWIMVEHILGVKATIEGLKVEPCLPRAWKVVSIIKQYVDKKYKIHIVNGEMSITTY